MKPKKIILFCLLLISVVASAQEKGTEPLEFAHFDCGITQTKQKMDYRLFASTPPIELRINNEKLSYTTFQFGKRKSKIYLYMRILIDNVCIRQDENVDVYFESGEIITLKNEYPLNCNSFFARQMKNRELKKFRENKISMIKIYTYKKNYEHRISDIQNHDIQHYIECLSEYKIKKSNEVKVKKNTKKDEKN